MGKRILLADDSVTIQKVVELTFMDEDYEVVAVSNGDEAVSRLGDVQPDLVIADVHMPGASGYDVCRRAKAWRRGTPVLLLVGTFEPFQEEEARRADADGYLKKPFDSQELLRRVEELISAASRRSDPPVTSTPADEMDLWQAPEAEDEPESSDLYSEGVTGEEPVGPLGQDVPEELVLEASPWTEAEERTGGPSPLDDTVARQPPPLRAPEPPASHASPTPALAQAATPAVAPATTAPSVPAPAPAEPASNGNGALSEADVDRIARRVVELLGDQLVREIAWEVVPDMAELVIKDRLRELERQLEGP
jgi:CheY-like chemotaxis protein